MANNANAARGVFITGTDTGVGKTFVACRLIRALEDGGLDTAVFKPVETGCRADGGANDDKLTPQDAVQLARASKHRPAIDAVCRHRFAAAVSPARAAQLAGVDLRVGDLAAACRSDARRFAVVEGAGGLLSPIAGDGVNADLAAALNYAVVVVAADRLGCINHVLLTLEALAARNLHAVAVALNRPATAPAPGGAPGDTPGNAPGGAPGNALNDALNTVLNDKPNSALDNAHELAAHTQTAIVKIGRNPDGGRGGDGIRRLAEMVRRAAGV